MNILSVGWLRAFGRTGSPDAHVGGTATGKWVRSVLESPLWARQRWLRLFGWPGMAGAALLAMCPTLYFSAVKPAQLNLEAVHRRAISVQERVKLAANGLGREQFPPAEQLAEFYRIFPSEKQMLPWLEKIFALAQRQGIELDRGEYKVLHERIGRLTRFQITLPVKSAYPQIRKFLNSLQVEAPIVSIEHLQFERQKIDAPVVDAKIVLALYLEHEP